ncbi:MAG: hypothetical protein NTX25_13775, partial [Proteobacteria bacterium]|nr:hypothetical protein [Pseudomonadota bacterium]
MRKIIALLSKITVMLPIGSLLLVPWFLVACDNGPKVSSIDGIQSAVKMTIFNDAGSGQVLTPRQTTSDSIIFTIRDGNGKAVPEAAISFKLIDVTGLTEINPDQLIAAWDAGKNSISTQAADPLATEEDVIGRIESAESKTDAQGQARVKLVAPDAYQKTIAVAARVQSGGTSTKDSGFGFATISTSGFGQSETYIFTTSRALQEITGEPFAISITAVRDGRIVKALNGKRKFEFSSWSVGRIGTDKFPKGEVDCVFINGTCRLDGGPFILMGFGQLNVKFRDTESKIPEQEIQIELERGRPSALVLSSTPGPILTVVCSSLQQPEAGKPCITFSADSDLVTLYPAIIDQGQNFVSTPPTKWSVSGVLERRIGAASATENQTIQPYKSGTGFFTVSGENFTLTASYSVVPGQPAAYLVSSENGGTEIATNPFKVKIKLFDRKENFCSNFSRDLSVRASLVGASASPGGNLPVGALSEVIPFVFGEGVSTQTLLATKAGEKPKINVQGAEGVADSDLLTILPGPTKSVKFRTAANNLGNLLDQPITLATDTRANFFVAGYDKFLNYTGETNS